jgi:hypothetical protein
MSGVAGVTSKPERTRRPVPRHASEALTHGRAPLLLKAVFTMSPSWRHMKGTPPHRRLVSSSPASSSSTSSMRSPARLATAASATAPTSVSSPRRSQQAVEPLEIPSASSPGWRTPRPQLRRPCHRRHRPQALGRAHRHLRRRLPRRPRPEGRPVASGRYAAVYSRDREWTLVRPAFDDRVATHGPRGLRRRTHKGSRAEAQSDLKRLHFRLRKLTSGRTCNKRP